MEAAIAPGTSPVPGTSVPGALPALEATEVTKHFAGLAALSDVSLRLEPGEVLGLMGPNGSGKSTMVNVISGILAPDAGRVVVDGRDVTGAAPMAIARAKVARSFQTVRLFGALTVAENVAAVIRNPARPIDTLVVELLARLRIDHLATTRASELAYGSQRRVEIARALATEPRYLLLDEPAAGLNDVESHDLEQIIRQLVAEFGLGVLIIDHDMQLISRLCDRLHVLANGRTLAEGPPDIVRTDPDVARAYLGDRAVVADFDHDGVLDTVPIADLTAEVVEVSDPSVETTDGARSNTRTGDGDENAHHPFDPSVERAPSVEPPTVRTSNIPTTDDDGSSTGDD